MRRSERLAEIVEIVRDGRLHLARDIAAALDVSLRTIYRDIDTLVAAGVPIEGERGVGYLLREPVFLPPRGLTLTEIEALTLGMAIVEAAADPELRAAARSVLDKLGAEPANRRHLPKAPAVGLYEFERVRRGLGPMPLIRRAIREGLKLSIDYHALDGRQGRRVIRPLRIEYWGRVWTCAAWCEAHGAFRAFRIDRITECRTTGAHFAPEPGKTAADYLRHVADSLARGEAEGR